MSSPVPPPLPPKPRPRRNSRTRRQVEEESEMPQSELPLHHPPRTLSTLSDSKSSHRTQSIVSGQSTALNSVQSTTPTIDTLAGSSILRKQPCMDSLQDAEVEESDSSTSESSPPQTPLTPYRPSSLHRSDSWVTQSSESSRRTQDSQRTQSSQRTYSTYRTEDTRITVSSGSTVPNPWRPPLLSTDSVDTLVGSGLLRRQFHRDSLQEKVDTSERLEAIRQEMAKHQFDYYIVLSEDAHGSEYVAASDKRREFISGFGGSAGEAIISKTAAYLVVDSRYWLQAEREVDPALWIVIRAGAPDSPKDWVEWLMGRIKGARVGIDARMLSHEKAVAINSKINMFGSKMVCPPQNLVDLVWKNKPPKSKALVFKQEIEYTGQDARQKVEKIRQWIREQRPSQPPYAKGPPTPAQKHVATLISSLPCIAWVLNLRGQDVPYNPLFHAYLYIGLDNAIVFLDGSKVDESVAGYLQEVGVERRDFVEVWSFLRKREWGEGKVLLSPQTSYAIASIVTQFRYTMAPPIVEHLMAVKNMVEIEGLKRAHIRDGAAFVQFLAWLEQKLKTGWAITEWEAANRLTEFRRMQRNFMGLAYETISASGPNAALPHYTPLKSEARLIDRDTPYLNDSGGQYRDGTCDTARTLHFGRPTMEQREAYTRVLQGHIAIDTAVFPEGTSGQQLDVLARKALWKDGMNYLHGTGHGFGSFLTVHEGSHGFSSQIPLSPGHVVTNEPGYYREGAWGMRIESALLVARVKPKYTRTREAWLGFERLTCVPIQTRMVKNSMLTKEEKAWLKEHNQRCYDNLVVHLKDDKRALKWLKREADRGIGLGLMSGLAIG